MDDITPDIRDAERLQGFEPDWTRPALDGGGVRPGHRWKLIGNAVSVPVAKWVGQRLAAPGVFDGSRTGKPMRPGVSWPRAAYGRKGDEPIPVGVSMWPVRWPRQHLSDFLRYPVIPLSERAAAGFLGRARASSLTFRPEFLRDVERHVARMRRCAVA